jgi:hypothetical protein
VKTMHYSSHWIRLFALAAILLPAACARFIERVPGEASADDPGPRLVAQLASANAGLSRFKGVGSCVLRRGGIKQIDERAAWVAAAPDKFSVVVFISGFPAIRFASNGEYIYYNDSRHDRNSYRRVRVSSAYLDDALGISIRPAELVQLLAGRIPLDSYARAQVASDPSGGGYRLTIWKWWGPAQKIALLPDKETPRSLESFSRSGSLRYRAVFVEWQNSGDNRVPAVLRISNDAADEFQLTIDRFWRDVSIDPAIFEIAPPR